MAVSSGRGVFVVHQAHLPNGGARHSQEEDVAEGIEGSAPCYNLHVPSFQQLLCFRRNSNETLQFIGKEISFLKGTVTTKLQL